MGAVGAEAARGERGGGAHLRAPSYQLRHCAPSEIVSCTQLLLGAELLCVRGEGIESGYAEACGATTVVNRAPAGHSGGFGHAFARVSRAGAETRKARVGIGGRRASVREHIAGAVLWADAHPDGCDPSLEGNLLRVCGVGRSHLAGGADGSALSHGAEQAPPVAGDAKHLMRTLVGLVRVREAGGHHCEWGQASSAPAIRTARRAPSLQPPPPAARRR